MPSVGGFLSGTRAESRSSVLWEAIKKHGVRCFSGRCAFLQLYGVFSDLEGCLPRPLSRNCGVRSLLCPAPDIFGVGFGIWDPLAAVQTVIAGQRIADRADERKQGDALTAEHFKSQED